MAESMSGLQLTIGAAVLVIVWSVLVLALVMYLGRGVIRAARSCPLMRRAAQLARRWLQRVSDGYDTLTLRPGAHAAGARDAEAYQLWLDSISRDVRRDAGE